MSDQELLTMFQILLSELQQRFLPEPEPPKIVEQFPQSENTKPLAFKSSHGVIVPREKYDKKDLVLWRKTESGDGLIARIVAVIEEGSYEISVKNLPDTKIIPRDQIAGLYIPN
jgi:hypothetical protein